MRLFSVYGAGENKKRLYPSLLKAINKNTPFFVKNPLETRDFSNIDFVVQTLLDATNFEKKKFKNYQIWHISENKPQKIIDFVKKIWANKKVKNKLLFNKKNKVKFNHISDKSSVWKITN
jgi:nucleoside-diphosphate-sugar epimerase